MSALAHYLEDEGLATVCISLVRAQSDAVAPPRALWVPFELGRPLGEPRDPPFQRAVLEAALALLDEAAGPVTREYEVDAPSSEDDPAWRGPDLSGCVDLDQELARLAPLHAQFLASVGRSTVGVSGLAPHARIAWLQGYPQAERPAPLPGVSDHVRLRFVADDHKAFYTEAASATGGRPSSRQLQHWLWSSTRLATLLRSLRQRGLDSTDERLVTVAGRFLVPADWR